MFLDNKPYLLTVMTKGSDKKVLPEIISKISTLVYEYVQGDKKIPA